MYTINETLDGPIRSVHYQSIRSAKHVVLNRQLHSRFTAFLIIHHMTLISLQYNKKTQPIVNHFCIKAYAIDIIQK